MALTGNSLRILVVDDSALARRWFATVLEVHDLRFASNGSEALALLSGDLDAVISDAQMPVLGGVELLQQVRQRLPALPRLLVTASGVETATAALEAGIATQILNKGDAPALLEALAVLSLRLGRSS